MGAGKAKKKHKKKAVSSQAVKRLGKANRLADPVLG